MEFLRFGSSIPGSYWGTCSMCIIQDFSQDPFRKASIQLVSGDSGCPMQSGKDQLYFGPTYEDIFVNRIRIGTFGCGDMPNHGFLAILTEGQLRSEVGKKWLALLKREGFEFIRTVDNSVYSGKTLRTEVPSKPSVNKNYLFGLFRNIGTAEVADPFAPPPEWTSLEQRVPEPWEFLDEKARTRLKEGQNDHHLKRWIETSPTVFMTEEELKKAGAPVILAGQRSQYPQQEKSVREQLVATQTKAGTLKVDPFAVQPEYDDEEECWEEEECDECEDICI